MSLYTWKLTSGTASAQIEKFVKNIDAKQVVNKSLSGAVYIQTIGSGTPYADITFSTDRLTMNAINKQFSEGAYFKAVYRGESFTGHFESSPQWSEGIPGKWYTGSGKLLIESEETSP